MNKLCCIIGAGYSSLAGLPMASKLFDKVPKADSKSNRNCFAKVKSHYDQWHKLNASCGPEEYLSELYLNQSSLFPLFENHPEPYSNSSSSSPSFQELVRFITAVLGVPGFRSMLPSTWRYQKSVLNQTHCEIHRTFWRIILDCNVDCAVVTTNYDIQIERCLRNRTMIRVFGPGCHYGGIPKPQFLNGGLGKIRSNYIQAEMDGPIPVMKLHGSLNWCLHENMIRIYHDVRPAHRIKDSAAIIPPIKEKYIPSWAKQIWIEAEKHLSVADTWIICGYSLPEYDTPIRELISRAAHEKLRDVVIIDPHARDLLARYLSVLGNANVICLQGLPDCLDELYRTLTALQSSIHPLVH